MTTKIKWRLSKLPDSAEITELLKAGILTKDEAREILISLVNDEDRDKESLQEEIRFLRQLVQNLSSTRTELVRTIEYVEKPYKSYPWYQQYQTYCSAIDTNNTLTMYATPSNQLYTASNSTGLNVASTFNNVPAPDFTDIKTF